MSFKIRPSRSQRIARLALEDNETLPIVSTTEPEEVVGEPVSPEAAELPVELDADGAVVDELGAPQVNGNAADVAEVGVAVQTAQTIDEAVATLESILSERAPTRQEIYLASLASNQTLTTLGLESVMVTSLAVEEDERRLQAETLKLQLEGISSSIWNAIKAGMAKIAAGYEKALKGLKWFFSSATTKLTKFRAELVAFQGEPKVPSVRFTGEMAHYNGLGYNLKPNEVIAQTERANEYVYRELFTKIAEFAVDGKNIPEVNDDSFTGLPGEPRFRFNAKGATLVQNPPRGRNAEIDTTNREYLIAWIDALLDEATYFDENYDSFKSDIEKVYDAVREATAEEDGTTTTAEDIADAAAKIMFSRSHSCIEAMEDWVTYVTSIMYHNFRSLMAIRSLAFA